MIATRETNQEPHIYLVSSVGEMQTSTVGMSQIGAELSRRHLSWEPIDGVYNDVGEQTVSYPSLQRRLIQQSAAELEPNRPVLIIAHSLGTIAAIGAQKQLEDTHPATIVSISPPLFRPGELLNHPRSQARRLMSDTKMRIAHLRPNAIKHESYTESIATIDPRYFEEIEQHIDLEQILLEQIEGNKAIVFGLEQDWNEQSPAGMAGWHNFWETSLNEQKAAVLKHKTKIIPRAAYDLTLTPRVIDSIYTNEDHRRFLESNVRAIIGRGLSLASELEVKAASVPQSATIHHLKTRAEN